MGAGGKRASSSDICKKQMLGPKWVFLLAMSCAKRGPSFVKRLGVPRGLAPVEPGVHCA